MAENKLWDLINEIYKTSECKKDFVKECDDYWRGNIKTDKIIYKDQNKSSFNIIKPIIETKLKAMLDSEFTLAVVPKLQSFASLNKIREQQDVADIMNDELHNVFIENNIDRIKELAGRYGLKCGFGVVKTFWDDSKEYKNGGKICIENIPSYKLKWDPCATTIDNASFVGYSFSISPQEAKNLYAKKENGKFDKEICKKIDNITVDKFNDKRNNGPIKGIINYKNDNVGSGQLYAHDGGFIKAGKEVKLVCLFLQDDSMYSPSKDDDDEEKKIKEESLKKYPYGRMIIFSKNSKEKLILEDKALGNSFNNLGNISIFNPIIDEDISGHGEIEDLMTIQDRINGLYHKYREELDNDFNSIAMEKDQSIAMDDVVSHSVLFLNKGAQFPQNVSNNGIINAQNSLSMIELLENQAAKIARVNETMIYGYRQTGTSSAEQVKMLQESPLADIRGYQRNFKDFLKDIGNKVLSLIKQNYTIDRIIKLSTGMSDADFAKLQLNTEDGQLELVLLNETANIIKKIKIDPTWEFQVEIVAGTEVPRSRKEQAGLYDNLISMGVFNLKNLELVEQYLKIQDVPNWRLIMKVMRRQQEQISKTMNSPENNNWKEMMKNPDIAKVFADNFKALTGYPEAQQQMLKEIGLNNAPAKLDNTPVTEITKQSDVAEVATMANIISNNPVTAAIGRDAAVAEQLTDAIG